MEFAVIIGLAAVFVYMSSFAKYNWDRQNRLGAAGVLLLALAAAVLPLIVIFR
jgi:hypothetical protein